VLFQNLWQNMNNFFNANDEINLLFSRHLIYFKSLRLFYPIIRVVLKLPTQEWMHPMFTQMEKNEWDR